MKNISDQNELLLPDDNSTPSNKYAIPMAVIIAGVIIASAIIYGPNQRLVKNTGSVVYSQEPQPSIQAVDISKVKIAGRPFIGASDAKISLAYWYDYQCPFCKKFEQETMPLLISELVQTGKIKIVFKNFQFLGKASQNAGLAARAVWEAAPDKFYGWHKAMYAKQDGENSGWGTIADILALTEAQGIDSSKVQELMTAKAVQYQKILDEDIAEGQSFGITGTPSTIIGKRLLIGSQNYLAFKQLIDLALAN